ncbi:MAG: HlyD family secretion protein, partial [Bacteroidales bacterium]|nr:HlyD family secretion protein [Bacteroidales bacterium]
RSEEVQEVMGKIPPWILRWGIAVLFIVVLSLVTGSCFFKYPDVIAAEMILTGQFPVAQVVSRASGKISKLYVTDGQSVVEGGLLAVIENPASTEDVFSLKERKGGDKELSLGDIQPSYAAYLQSLHEYENYYALNYYPKRIAAMQRQIEQYRVYYQNMERRQGVVEDQYRIARQQYERDSTLFARQVLSPSEHETARNVLLQSLYTLESGRASLENFRLQIAEMETNILDIGLQQAEKEIQVEQGLRTAAEQLSNAINSWELTYCLVSPIRGKVTFTKYWNENQYVTAGEGVFTVVPGENAVLIGKALLPVSRSGKVRIGQRVMIRFANFPDQEFGIVNGVVNRISLVPSDNNYQVEIGLPDGLTTNYRKTLPVTHEMKASAEIVTEDLRLIERFFMPIKRALKEGF